MFGRTRSVLNKIIKDINKLRRVMDIILQVILLALCGYNIFKNITHTVKLIIYILMFICSLYWLVYSARFYTGHSNKKTKKVTQRTIKYIKLSYRLILVIFSLVDVFTGQTTGFAMFMSIFSAASFVLTILTTVISRVIGYYLELLTIAFEEDAKPIANTIETIKNPLYAAAKAINKEEEVIDPSRKEKLDVINSLNDERKEAKDIKKEEFKKHKLEVIKQAFSFKKKNKDQKEETK